MGMETKAARHKMSSPRLERPAVLSDLKNIYNGIQYIMKIYMYVDIYIYGI